MNQTNSFSEFKLEESLVHALNKMGYQVPSEIQVLSLKPILDGQDIICQAEAGKGKTLCFLIPILQKAFNLFRQNLTKHKKICQQALVLQNLSLIHPFSLIIVPTRELAIQIMDVLSKIIKLIITQYPEDNQDNSILKEYFQPHLFIGGLPIEKDRDVLKTKRCNIIIGTAGRIVQLIQEKLMQLHNLQILVLDEADKLQGSKQFSPYLKKIYSQVQLNRTELNKVQILCFSATFSTRIQDMLQDQMKNPTLIKLEHNNQIQGTLEQYYVKLEQKEDKSLYQQKQELILELLKKLELKQTIIFYNDKNRGENLFNDLRAEGFTPVFIHGDLIQSDRIKIMHQMKRNKANIVVSTDLLSRGIDVDTLDLVVHFDKPSSNETYLHRIGRTARYGKYGLSILICQEVKQNMLLFQNANLNEINQKLQEKHGLHQTRQEYYAEFLNGVSDWKQTQFKFYDESKFNYFEQAQQNESQKQKDNDEIVIRKKVKIENSNSVNQQVLQDQELLEIFKCSHCKEFYNKFKQFSNKLEIYFN
ncbi:hypothetical protein pb186bvf_017618 [Paramecium bursaria]